MILSIYVMPAYTLRLPPKSLCALGLFAIIVTLTRNLKYVEIEKFACDYFVIIKPNQETSALMCKTYNDHHKIFPRGQSMVSVMT